MAFEIINKDAINQSMMGNDEFIKQLVEMYIIQSPIDFEALENAILSGDRKLIREKAHHIKPTMKYIGANALLHDFESLENLAKEEVNQAEIDSSFQELKPKFIQMLDELKVLAES